MAGLVAWLQACAANPAAKQDAEALKAPTESAMLQACRRALTDHNPTVVSRIGGIQLTVRMATAAELPEDESNAMLFFTAEGGGSLALGLVAPPLYASALVVGGILIIPLGTYLYIHEKYIGDTICDTFGRTEFTRAIVEAFRRRLMERTPEADLPEAEVEIIVAAYGLVSPAAGGRSCLVAAADFICRREGRVPVQERMQIAEINRSEDAPPPQCASLERLTADDGRLMETTLAEYAEVLAVMAIDRLAQENNP